MTASFAQTSFLGGEWSPQMQGRFDRPDYREGMNVCLNIIPIEEGAAPRRSGTRLGGVTRNGAYGVLREYGVSEAQPYDLELTAGFLRIWLAGAGLVTHAGTAISAISSASSAVFTSASHGFTTGDQAIFDLGAATTYSGIAQVLGRQFSVTVLTSSTFTVVDALTGAAVDGAQINFAVLSNLKAYRIYELVTPYTKDELQQVRLVQDGTDALLLHPNHPPQTFKVTTDATGAFTAATLTPTVFYDGPYLDIPSDGTTLTPSGTTGTITFTASAITSINGGTGFQPSDVGRMLRFFSEPPDWVADTYAAGEKVKEAGVYWRAVGNGVNNPLIQPSTDSGINWVIDPTAAAWTWGTIASVVSTTVVTATMHAEVKYPDNTAGGDLLYTTPAIAWQLGAYSATSGYPAVGAYYQGRIWLGGAIKNRFDACVSNDFSVNGYINFAPTGLDGTVADNNGIAGTLNAKEIENFLWMLPDEQGVLAGTQSGEWTISASGENEPITSTSIVTRETSHYGSIAQAIKVNRATIFVHRDERKVYEYMANYTRKFVADNLSLKAKHLTKSGVAEIAYMRELTPIIWCRLNNGGLIGCTYKHDDPIKPLEFSAWHHHTLGTGRDVISIQGGPANGGESDTISLVTQDTVTDFCYVEFLQTLWDEGDDLLTAWYVDGGASIVAAELVDPVTIRLYGMWYMAGQTVTVWGAGLDLGDYTVSAVGTVDLPFNAQTSLFTSAYLAAKTALGCKPLGTDIVGTSTGSISTYVMEAKENYDAAHVATIAGLTTYTGALIRADQNWQGIQWDAVRRNLMYMYTEKLPTTPTTNTTGHRLWDGKTAITAGSVVDPDTQFNSSVGVKNIDTDVVTYHLNYNVANVVPNGIGGSDGTARRYTRDFFTGPDVTRTLGNGPGMTDPYTGNFWVNSSSCELYCFRAADNYSQIISPLFPAISSTNDVIPLGFTTNGATGPWVLAQEIGPDPGTETPALYLVPKDITAAETSADYLLAYATFTYPVTQIGDKYRIYNREVFDHAGNMYLFSCARSGAKNFKLYRFALPSSAPYGGPTVGGGFTDITPWGAAGPNADGAAYTHARLEFGDTVTPASHSLIPLYLPATDTLALIEKFFPSEKSNGDDYLTPGDMFWSCTYVGTPAGTPTYDHHSAFVTGYMTAAWAPTDAAGAAYTVADAFEVNTYLGQSDYSYSIDYTTRWFFFVCTKVTAGVSDGKPRIVLVEYKFVSGSAPSVVRVIDEQGWNDAYPAYTPSTDAYDPYVNTAAGNVAASMTTWLDPCYPQPRWDAGIYDPVTNSFWWSGGATPQNDSTQTAIFGQFDAAFADRMQTALAAPGGTLIAATPPFLKLSFGDSAAYCVPFAVGHTYCSRGQILRPATPQESMTQTGPSMGKKRRTTYAAPLLVDTQGMSMGVDFLTMRPLAFKSPGGTVDLTLAQTFSGVYWGTVDADSNYDNMWCWEVCRPYPCTVVAVEVQHKVSENV